MKKEDLASRVKTVLNEYGSDLALSISDDNVKLTNYIDQALDDAVVVLSKEGVAINPKYVKVEVVSNNQDSWVDKPEDFISIISIKLDTWERSVTRLSPLNSAEFKRSENKYTKPGKNSPICYSNGDGMIYCAPTGDNVAFMYNAKLGESFLGDENAANAVVYMAASLVLAYFEDDNGKNRLAELASLYLK